MIEMPKQIQIGTIAYRVTTDEGEWYRYEHGIKRSNDYGHTDNDAAVIYINPNSAPSVKRLSLWHEVLHAAISSMMGCPDWRNLGDNEDDREERVVRMFEHPTLAVLRYNPELMLYLGDLS